MKIIKKYLVLTITIILFFIPFFWFSYGELDLGGDSSRLYFLDPYSWLKNIGLYSVNSLSSLGFDSPSFFMLPFLLFLSLTKLFLLKDPYFLNCFFLGMLLSGGFLFTYLSIIEILNYKSKTYKFSAIIGGLFFIFSPLVIYDWRKALYSINSVLVYPIIFYLFIRYIKSQKYQYIIISVIVTFVFSVNFSSATFPWFFSFFIFIFSFLFLYSVIIKKRNVFLKGLCLFIILFLLVQSFQLIPQASEMLDPSSSKRQLIFSEEGKINRGLNYFLSVQPYVRLVYNLTNQPQYDISVAFNHPNKETIYNYGIKYWYVFFVYSLIIFSPCILLGKNFINNQKQDVKKIYLILMSIFLILLFFMTANINNFLLELYKKMFSIPGFSVFRSFYEKFAMTFAFFYALLLGLSLYIIFKKSKSRMIKAIIIILLTILIVFNGWPLVSGKIVNETLWQSKNVKIITRVDPKYILFLDYVKNKHINSKYISFPLTGTQYQLLKGKEEGAYFGPSNIAILAGKNDFNGLNTFSNFRKEIVIMLQKNNFDLIEMYLASFNIGYIIHNSDNYIYDNFPCYPYPDELKKIFPDQNSIENFIKDLKCKKVKQITNFNLYEINKEFFLPHFYISKNVIISNKEISNLLNIFSQPNYQIRSAVYFENQNQDKIQKINQLSNTIENTPILEFKKINPTKYRVIIHGASDDFPLVFSESFHEGWKAYLVKPSNFQFSIFNFQSNSNDKIFNDQNLDTKYQILNTNYKILDGNEDDQASREELIEYIDKGWISSLGDGKEKEIKHKKWENNKEKLDYVEKYNIDFVSKNFQDTIQNDNLFKGHIWDTWFKKPLNEENHLMANGYANSWWIETEKICNENPGFCVKNPPCEISAGAKCDAISHGKDGSYDFEMIIEFWPQRLFYLGSGISSVTLLICLSYLCYNWRREKKKRLK